MTSRKILTQLSRRGLPLLAWCKPALLLFSMTFVEGRSSSHGTLWAHNKKLVPSCLAIQDQKGILV